MVADVSGDGVPDVLFGRGLGGDLPGTGGATYDPPFYIGTGPVPANVLTENLPGQRASQGVPDIFAPEYSGGVMVLVSLTKQNAISGWRPGQPPRAALSGRKLGPVRLFPVLVLPAFFCRCETLEKGRYNPHE
jgi:hypothetical protein